MMESAMGTSVGDFITSAGAFLNARLDMVAPLL